DLNLHSDRTFRPGIDPDQKLDLAQPYNDRRLNLGLLSATKRKPIDDGIDCRGGSVGRWRQGLQAVTSVPPPGNARGTSPEFSQQPISLTVSQIFESVTSRAAWATR